MVKNTIILLIYISCSFTLLVGGKKYFTKAKSRSQSPLKPEPLGEKMRSRSHLKKKKKIRRCWKKTRSRSLNSLPVSWVYQLCAFSQPQQFTSLVGFTSFVLLVNLNSLPAQLGLPALCFQSTSTVYQLCWVYQLCAFSQPQQFISFVGFTTFVILVNLNSLSALLGLPALCLQSTKTVYQLCWVHQLCAFGQPQQLLTILPKLIISMLEKQIEV